MKYIILTLAAATICFTACKKQQTPAPVAPTETTTASDFNGSKAVIAGRHMKQAETGLEFDYGLVIKEVSDNKYEAAVKLSGMTANGKKVEDPYKLMVSGMSLTLSSPKESGGKLVVKVKSPSGKEVTLSNKEGGSADMVVNFPPFESAENIANELLDVQLTFNLDAGSVKVSDKSTFSFCGLDIYVLDPKIDVYKTSWDIPVGIGSAGAKGKDAGHEKSSLIPLNFAISYSADKGNEKCDVVVDNTVFVLPKGYTVTQEPKVSKVTIQGTNGYVTVTITGDPAGATKGLIYTPAGDTKEQTVMKFVPTHTNLKQGIQRFISTQTWEQVYGKTAAPNFEKFGEGWARITRIQ